MLSECRVVGAAWISLAVGVLSRRSLLIGLPVGLVLARLAAFPGARSSVAWHMCAGVARVITGLGLLLLFVALDLESGFTTIVIAHASLATAYVAISVHARLVDFDPRSRRRQWILGATPVRRFAAITCR